MKSHHKILMYHSIGSPGSSEVGAGLYCVPVEKFREQVLWVSELAGYRVNEFNPSTRQPVNPPTILLTFDDGLLDNYTNAYPILKELGLTAYFFILVSKVGARGYMNWEQIRRLRDAGMTVGSHGMTHKILSGLNERDLDYELRISKKTLEDELKCAIDYFSVPRGFYNNEIIKQAKNNGYKAVFTSNPKDNDGFKFGRIPIKGNWELDYFIKVINNGFSLKDKTEMLVRNSAKRILGAKNYDRVRTIILGRR